MKIAYARVSTTGQNEAAQVDILTRHGAEEMFIDKASGTTRDGRPKLAEAIKFARTGDVLMVTRLDRLARSVSDLHSISKELDAKGVDLIVTEQSIDTTTPHGRLMFNMLAAIAEFETDLRKERQLEGIAKAKEEGRYKGRPVTVDVQRPSGPLWPLVTSLWRLPSGSTWHGLPSIAWRVNKGLGPAKGPGRQDYDIRVHHDGNRAVHHCPDRRGRHCNGDCGLPKLTGEATFSSPST